LSPFQCHLVLTTILGGLEDTLDGLFKEEVEEQTIGKAKQLLKEIMECNDCKLNFDEKEGFKFCNKHFKIFKKAGWSTQSLE